MLGKELVQYDPSFQLSKEQDQGSFDKFKITGLCDRYSLQEGGLYFCGSEKFLEILKDSSEKRVVLLLAEGLVEKLDSKLISEVLFWGTVKNVPLSMSYLSKPFYEELSSHFNDEVDGRQMGTADIHPSAIISQQVFIGKDVVIEKDVTIHPGAVIMSQSQVGEGTVIYPQVTCMPQTKIGKNCRIHSGTVIGSDGFGYNYLEGVHHKVWHLGGVQIEDNVEIGSNTSIDQGTFSPTVIGQGSKLDNQVQVAHNVKLGPGVILCGQVGLSGSSSVGDFTVIGGQAGVAPDCHVGKGCQVGGSAGVTTPVEDGAVVAGFPARPIKEWLRGLAYLRKMTVKK